MPSHNDNTSFYAFCVMFSNWLTQTYGTIDRFPDRLDTNVFQKFLNYSNDIVELWAQRGQQQQIRRTG